MPAIPVSSTTIQPAADTGGLQRTGALCAAPAVQPSTTSIGMGMP
jgi:hypothetical protein